MLHLVFWGLVLILALSFFGISVESILNSPAGQANIAYISHLFAEIWAYFAPYLERIRM